MCDQPFVLQQNIFKEHHPSLHVIPCHENALSEKVVLDFLRTVDDHIGLAPTYSSNCSLASLAFSSSSQVLLVTFSTKSQRGKKKNQRSFPGRDLLRDFILCDTNSARPKVAFKMDRLALALYLDFGLRICDAIDLLSVVIGAGAKRQSVAALSQALGGELSLHKANVVALFKHEERKTTPVEHTALQAWSARHATTLTGMSASVDKVPKIHTNLLCVAHLDILGKTCRHADRLVMLKPTRVKNDVEAEFSVKSGKVNLTCKRFKTRVMISGSQSIEIKTGNQGKAGHSVQTGRATLVNGRAVQISVKGQFSGSSIASVTTVGREDPTQAEASKSDIVLMALQGRISILKHSFTKRIWLPSEALSWADSPAFRSPISIRSSRPLNPSQTKAVHLILSTNDEDRVGLIHGPPGTGKTTVIAAAVTSVMASSDITHTVWLVAQSNVAVKNIAEKLASENFFDFKILVSKDFHFDWHEHLYEKIERNVIRSDDFVPDRAAMSRLLLGSRVILCTLSMLSADRLGTIARIVPVQTVIFDEASQIEIGDYLPPLHRFQKTLRKLVFIGDDKQLAPYGQGDISELQSIFEKSHLRPRAVFLDTQYRMPIPIGDFISRRVYDNRLHTVHDISSVSCCRFVDVRNGVEQQKGFSWINTREVQAAICIAQKLYAQGKSYRIITPYDSQRSMLENALKQAGIPWKDKCFNVDSFQGNEDDYIIVSLVRSKKIGFLREDRRVNVMLTRCKRGMIICTSRSFLNDIAPESLVGGLAEELGNAAWIEASQVLNKKVNLFGY